MEFSNKIIKDRIRILENSNDVLRFRTYLEPKGGQNQLHYHTKINERFKILRGELSVIINNNTFTLKPGKQLLIKPFTNHMFFNNSKNQVVFDVEIENPNKMISALQIIYGLSENCKTTKKGIPKNIFYTAIALNMMDAFSPKVPHKIQKLGITILGLIGKLLGLEKMLLERYCSKTHLNIATFLLTSSYL